MDGLMVLYEKKWRSFINKLESGMCWEDVVKNVETFLSNFLHLFPSKIIFSLQL